MDQEYSVEENKPEGEWLVVDTSGYCWEVFDSEQDAIQETEKYNKMDES